LYNFLSPVLIICIHELPWFGHGSDGIWGEFVSGLGTRWMYDTGCSYFWSNIFEAL
jgi:hypothetical protein